MNLKFRQPFFPKDDLAKRRILRLIDADKIIRRKQSCRPTEAICIGPQVIG